MNTIKRARQIASAEPSASLKDAIGLATVVLILFVGFLAPAVI